VASAYEGAVVRLAHDRRHELLRYGFMAYPWIVEADPVTGSAWVVDAIYGTVSEITTSGEERVRLGWFRQPSDIALDHRRRYLWILEQTSADSAVVHKYSTDGTLIFTRGGLVSPARLAVDTKTGSCFIADARGRKVVRVAANGRVSDLVTNLVWPTGLACDAQSGQLWIVDGTQVLLFSLGTGAVSRAEGSFVRAYLAAANDSTGECWVVDLGSGDGQAQVVRLDRDGRRIASYGPFVQPYGVAVNLYDGCCIVADTGANRLVEISPEGAVQELPVRVARPWDVVVENHYPLRGGG
jgi:DNA-binding beta-propeller fold protein YncE